LQILHTVGIIWTSNASDEKDRKMTMKCKYRGGYRQKFWSLPRRFIYEYGHTVRQYHHHHHHHHHYFINQKQKYV